MNDLLVPAFARADEYVGLWLIDQNAADKMWRMVSAIDIVSHIKNAEPPKMVSSIEKIPAQDGSSVATIRLQGTLMKGQSSMGGTSTIQARRDIRNAAADPEVSSILLLIDSPGGTVAGTYELARDIQGARSAKPVFAHVEDLGASAAYWAASQTDKVFANAPTALVGSIGTVQVMYDMSAAAESQGIKTYVFRTGPLKGMGAQGDKITEEQASHVQGLIDQVQKSFDTAVMDGRKMTAKELTSVRHGGVLTAQQALEAKLIDAIQPLSKTINDLAGGSKKANRMRSYDSLQADGRSAGTIPMLGQQTLPMLR